MARRSRPTTPKCTIVGLGIAPLIDIGTQWHPLSADIEKRSQKLADEGTFQHRSGLPDSPPNTSPTRLR